MSFTRVLLMQTSPMVPTGWSTGIAHGLGASLAFDAACANVS